MQTHTTKQTSTMIGKPKAYAVYADGDREYRSTRKREVLSVALAWRKQGIEPKVWAIGDDAEGLVTCDEITEY